MANFAIPGGPQANATASGGKVYAYNTIDTTPQTVVPANPQRRKVSFHNPGDVDIYIAPALAYASVSAASPTALTPAVGSLGGCRTVYANGGTLDIEGECQGAWQAFSASASGKPLTVMDSNI